MIERLKYLQEIEKRFKTHRIVVLLGPRQCGKTTLAKQYQAQQGKVPPVNYFDLENPLDIDRLENVVLSLESLKGLIIIDEVQKRPDLFSALRYIHDTYEDKKFLLLGSAAPKLLKQSSESLTGRISFIEVMSFSLLEVHETQKLWVYGGFPKSYLSSNEEESFQWRKDYIRTFLEQDIPNLGIRIQPNNLRRFWMMLAHYHGQQFNASEIGKSLSINHTSVRDYLDVLSQTFMIRILQPWFENISKRQIKSPKVYFRDTGLFNCLLQLKTYEDLLLFPKIGAAWEGFALEQVIQFFEMDSSECFYWGLHGQGEIDLLIFHQGKKRGFEFKYGDSPKKSSSMMTAIETLGLEKLYVIYPGKISYPLTEKIWVVGLKDIFSFRDGVEFFKSYF